MKYSIPVWKMIVNSIEQSNKKKEYLTINEIRKLVSINYPKENVNPRTIELQTIFHCINHPGNKHGGGLHEKNPLFRTDVGKFKLLTKEERKN